MHVIHGSRGWRLLNSRPGQGMAVSRRPGPYRLYSRSVCDDSVLEMIATSLQYAIQIHFSYHYSFNYLVVLFFPCLEELVQGCTCLPLCIRLLALQRRDAPRQVFTGRILIICWVFCRGNFVNLGPNLQRICLSNLGGTYEFLSPWVRRNLG